MPTIRVEIVSAEGEIFSGDAEMVFAPAKMGELGIAPRHAPLLTNLKPGEVRVQVAADDERFFYITGGIMEIQPHVVTVLADSAMHGADLDEDAAREAMERAREVLEGMHTVTNLEQAQAEMVEAEARFRAAQKLRGRRK